MQEWQARADDGRETTLSLPGVASELAGSATVEYRTTVPEPDPSSDIAVLTLGGLYARAEISVEGRLDGDGPLEHDAYFLPARVPFVPDGETEVRVTCRAPADRFGGSHDTDLVAAERAVPGVWWDARVETGRFPYLEAVTARPERGADGWVLHIETSVFTESACSERLTYSVRPEGRSRGGGTMERTTVEAEGPGRTTVEHTLRLRDPAPWWPRGFGEQHRHVLRVTLGEQERTVSFGVRDVNFVDGELRVNGETVPVRGVNLVDAGPDDVERALDVNANLIRAHAHVPPATFYEACDEAGLLVWQDLPLTGPGGFDIERGRMLAGALARHTGSHPSVAMYAAHDDPVTVAEELGGGVLDRLRLRWRAWRADYDPERAAELAAALPDPAVPAVGGPGTGCEAGAYYAGWQYGRPTDIERLLARYPADPVAEYGAPAPAPSDREGAADESEMSRPMTTSARSHDDDPATARAAQAALVGTISERLRAERVGAVAFCLRDASEASFGVYGQDGRPKPARDALARAFQPVQALLVDPSPGDSRVVVVNDTPETVTATLRWHAGDAGDARDVSVEDRSIWTGDPIPIPGTAETVSLELEGASLDVENRYSL